MVSPKTEGYEVHGLMPLFCLNTLDLPAFVSLCEHILGWYLDDTG